MIKADIPQDVTEYKEKFFFGLSTRQLICVVLMLVLAILTFLVGSNYITTDILVYLIVVEVAPLAAIGFLNYNGMGFEKIIIKVTDFYFGNQHRKIRYLPEETEIHDIIREIALNISETERKEELKQLRLQKRKNKRRKNKCPKK